MNKVLPFILDYYDREVSQMISKKYGFPIMDAYKKFMFSKTYEMLSIRNSKCGILVVSEFSTCGKRNKGPEIRVIPFTLGDANG